MVGSTANIVASGLLEKHGHEPVKFFDWIKIGAVVGLVTGVVAWVMLVAFPHATGESQEPSAPVPVVEQHQPAELEIPSISPYEQK